MMNYAQLRCRGYVLDYEIVYVPLFHSSGSFAVEFPESSLARIIESATVFRDLASRE